MPPLAGCNGHALLLHPSLNQEGTIYRAMSHVVKPKQSGAFRQWNVTAAASRPAKCQSSYDRKLFGDS
ncbi:uncharacterized protein N7529_007104 [Penicillium soppii]|uniref:uncharacterized protein n=1 Tax=Penicillium soppii TaxID=69789 RepID=UPI0025466DEC|nr:uncharacterized protein N7529_007104 [Penicillium soppii]KAJ5865188.1 hypothetical protein N7529_007104 [Penicillium soppii]